MMRLILLGTLALSIGCGQEPPPQTAAKAWLWPLLDNPEERVVMGAIEGVSAFRGDDVTARVAGILADRGRSDRVRIAAAAGLGTVGTPAARDALVRTFGQTSAGDLATEMLRSLGQFDFSSVAATFARYLAAPETPGDMRAVAVEALANSSPSAVPFLLRLAARDADANVRASAAWAISAHATERRLGRTLTGLAEREAEPNVRRRLYEALWNQRAIPAGRLLPTVMAEQDIAARVAGFDAIGRGTYQRPTSAIARRFDAEIVPELMHIATAPNSLNIQMRAVFALRRAQTPGAQAALAAISQRAVPQVATAARNGLPGTSS